ncbi:hypothetical protein PoB_002044900 [Plakobranchus ocellatus]|uniref:Uncharacterized protein n=1 Tax=Plakobranchus ocellatus TaxID=259542 RepID=A0AAV3ZF32_9GAST|nr:hypothetical protein PoB_002044900 [Plakobranchus ocellatus]
MLRFVQRDLSQLLFGFVCQVEALLAGAKRMVMERALHVASWQTFPIDKGVGWYTQASGNTRYAAEAEEDDAGEWTSVFE